MQITFTKQKIHTPIIKTTFKSKGLKNSTMICNDFFGKYKDVFGDVPFEKIATEIIQKSNNFLAEGNSKKVFIIDRIKDFLLYLKKEEFNSASMLQPKSFTPIEDPIPEYNFGQPFASNGQGLYLSRKINGETHSLPNWFNRAVDVIMSKKDTIKPEENDIFLKKIFAIKDFPIEAYNNYAYQINILNKHNIRVDAINPNNILVDFQNQTISQIDLEENQKLFTDFPKPLNSSYDMVTTLLDAYFHTTIKNTLSQPLKNLLENAVKTIIEKCKVAGDNLKIGFNQNNTKLHFKIVQDYYIKTHHIDFKTTEQNNEFINEYKDIL